jgi:hypothetical protein
MKKLFIKLPQSFTTVTKLSKAITILLFIFLPFIGFYLGYQYRIATTPTEVIIRNTITPIVTKTTISPTPSEVVIKNTTTPVLTKTTISPNSNIDRTPFTQEVQQQLNVENKLCELIDKFNSDQKIAEWINYSDSEISFKMPYSTIWGNEKYLIPPYESEIREGNNTKSILFGRVVLGVEGCGGGRSYYLTISDKQPLSEVAAKAKNQSAENIKTQTINNIPVLFYDEAPGMLSKTYAVISGEVHNYYLTSYFDDIMPVIQSFELK